MWTGYKVQRETGMETTFVRDDLKTMNYIKHDKSPNTPHLCSGPRTRAIAARKPERKVDLLIEIMTDMKADG